MNPYKISKKTMIVLAREKKRSTIIKSNGIKTSFNIHNLYKELLTDDLLFKKYSQNLDSILELTGIPIKYSKKILVGIIRFSFLCQPVLNEAASASNYLYRWDLPQEESRFANKQVCCEIFNFIYEEIFEFLLRSNQEKICLLMSYIDNNSCPYDIPVDYKKLNINKIHSLDNVIFYDTKTYRDLLLRRIILLKFLKNKLPKKTLTKTQTVIYKTGRGITGDHKSNREYRWETITKSPQSATKKDCWEIEIKLLEQICCMEGFPKEKLTDELIDLKNQTTMCPVMLLPITIKDFKKVDKSKRGKSLIHLGHIEPKSNTKRAHTQNNISWISDEGNRMQGDSSIKDFHKKILKLALRLKTKKK